jgi:hypothetical protein
MAQIVKLRRSSVSGQKPTNSNLQLGELALNTTDGKVYMAKSGSLGPSVEELISTNTVNTGSIHLVGDVTASNFSGSFIGDGSQLYNIPSSGVTGLELNKIISGSVSASISPNRGLEINTDTSISGSVKITNDLYVTGNVYFGTGDLNDIIVVKSYFSASIIADSDGDHYLGQPLKRWANVYSSTGSFNNLMGNSGSTINIFDATITGSMTGSFTGDGAGLYNIPASGVTGLELNKIVSGSVSASIQSDGTFRVNGDTYIDGILTAKELHMDYVTSSILYTSGSSKFGDTTDDTHNFTGSVYIDGNLNVDSITGSIDYNNLTNVPTLVSGSSQISYTGITNIPNGIVSSSQQVVDLGFTTTSSFESFTSSYTTHSSSFNSRINSITGSINNITSSLSHLELFSSSIDNFTSSVVLTSQTSSMTVLSSSYALTASYELNGGGGGTEGRTAKLIQNSASTTWTFTHNLGEQYPAITIFNEFDDVVIPTSVNAQDDNTIIVTFSSPQSGIATATVGGGLPFISGSYQGRVLAVDNNSPVWKSGIISGSLQVSNFGFATTGSNNFKGDQYVSGSIIIGESASIGSKCITISSTTQIINLSSFDGANFDYVVKNGSNMRAGVIMSVWNGSSSVYNESSTMDLGNTSGVTFNVTSSGGLNAAVTSGTWTVEVLYRALGCGITIPTGTETPTPTPTSTPTPTPTPTPGSTNYMISATGSTAPNYCDGLGGPFTVSVYGDNNVWTSVTRFYTDSGMTTPFNGNHLYYGDSNSSFGTTLQIDPSGYVTDFYAC